VHEGQDEEDEQESVYELEIGYNTVSKTAHSIFSFFQEEIELCFTWVRSIVLNLALIDGLCWWRF
jgi:hypothetical protein